MQWGAHGYFYPIQIAQYGLSHYSKDLTEGPPNVVVIENAETDDGSKWSTHGGHAVTVNRIFNDDVASHVMEFKTSGNYGNLGIASGELTFFKLEDMAVLNILRTHYHFFSFQFKL